MLVDHKFCRWLAFVLCICICLGNVPTFAAKKEDADPYPAALQITIERETWTTEDKRTCETALPVTCLENVNTELLEAQQALFEDLKQHVSGKQTMELEATYRISGTKWAGFILMGRVFDMLPTPNRGNETETTVYLNYRVFTYDMESGEALNLSDVFPEESEAWDTIATLMQESYHAFYQEEEKDAAAIEALCAKEALMSMPFLPSAGRLTLTTPLEVALVDRWQLVSTFLPYPDFRELMNEEAAQQTDNSHRRIIAITYDDGPNLDNTPKVIRALNNYGANSTFFAVGLQLEKYPDLTRRELDYGHTVGNHTYRHRYDFQVRKDYLLEDREQCLALHEQMTGQKPVLFRAPGGNVDGYLKHKIGWPIILWYNTAGDTGNNNAYQLAERIYNYAIDGAIFLMHDIYYKTAKGSEMFLSRLAADGFLFATVDELLYLHGIVPQPDTVYYDANTPPITEIIK